MVVISSCFISKLVELQGDFLVLYTFADPARVFVRRPTDTRRGSADGPRGSATLDVMRRGQLCTIDGVQQKGFKCNAPRSSAARAELKKFEKLWVPDAADNRANRKRAQRAMAHLTKAAELGGAGAAFNAAETYWNGHVAGIPRDWPRALDFYFKVFENSAEAEHEMAVDSLIRVLNNFAGLVSEPQLLQWMSYSSTTTAAPRPRPRPRPHRTAPRHVTPHHAAPLPPPSARRSHLHPRGWRVGLNR